MSIQELIDEAENRKQIWYVPASTDIFYFPAYYGNEREYMLWLKKAIKYLKQNFHGNDDAKRFIELACDSTSHSESEFDEMICCLQMLVDENEVLPVKINENELISLDIVDRAPTYIKDVLIEINSSYKFGLYNSCAILLRKITENLIIEAFDKNDRLDEIKDQNGDFFTLKNLISKLLNASPFLWNISRNTKKSLEEIKIIGDLSAHNIRFSAKKGDIDKIITDYRITLQEINLSIYNN